MEPHTSTRSQRWAAVEAQDPSVLVAVEVDVDKEDQVNAGPVEAEVQENRHLEMEGKDLASMTPKEARLDYRLTLQALAMGPLSLERHSKVPLEARSKEARP